MDLGGMGIGDMMRLMGRMGQLREQITQSQERARRRTVEGAAGGGLVKVTVNGLGEVRDVTFDPEALMDPEMLGPLTAGAVNTAVQKSREVMAEEMQRVLGEMGLPPGLLNGKAEG